MVAVMLRASKWCGWLSPSLPPSSVVLCRDKWPILKRGDCPIEGDVCMIEGVSGLSWWWCWRYLFPFHVWHLC